MKTLFILLLLLSCNKKESPDEKPEPVYEIKEELYGGYWQRVWSVSGIIYVDMLLATGDNVTVTTESNGVVLSTEHWTIEATGENSIDANDGHGVFDIHYEIIEHDLTICYSNGDCYGYKGNY